MIFYLVVQYDHPFFFMNVFFFWVGTRSLG